MRSLGFDKYCMMCTVNQGSTEIQFKSGEACGSYLNVLVTYKMVHVGHHIFSRILIRLNKKTTNVAIWN